MSILLAHSLNCRFSMERLLKFSHLPLERFSKIHDLQNSTHGQNIAILQWITWGLVAAQTTRKKSPIETLNENCGMCGWSSCSVVGIWGIFMFRDLDAEYCNIDIPITVKDDFLRICPPDLFWGLNLSLLYDDDALEHFMATHPYFCIFLFCILVRTWIAIRMPSLM